MANTAIRRAPSRRAREIREITDPLAEWVIAAVITVALIVGFYAIFRNDTSMHSSAPTASLYQSVPNIPNTGGAR